MTRILLILGGLLVVAVLCAALAWTWLNRTVQAGLTDSLSRALKADVHFDSVTVNLWAGRVEAHQGTLHNHDSAALWSDATVDQVTGSFSFGDLFAPVTPVAVKVDGVKIEVRTLGSNSASAPEGNGAGGTEPDAHNWPRVEVRSIKLAHGDMTSDSNTLPFEIKDISAQVQSRSGGRAWDGTVGAGGSMLNHWVLGKSSASFSTDAESLRITQFSVEAGTGSISGRIDVPSDGPEHSHLHFDFKLVPTNVIVSPRWQIFLSGLATGSGDYRGPLLDWSKGEAESQVKLEQAQLASLAFLKSVALIPGLGQMGGISLDAAGVKLTYKQGAFTFTELELTKTGFLSFRGAGSVGANETLDSTLQLGLPISTVALVPTLKDKVFSDEHDGLDWTQVKIWGTPDNLQEDLSPRLLAVAQQQGSSLINAGLEKANDLLNGLTKPSP